MKARRLLRPRFLYAIVMSLCAGFPVCAPAQDVPIPRERLVTDAELLALLELPAALEPGVRDLLGTKDTTAALRMITGYFGTRTAPAYFFGRDEVRERAAEFARSYPDVVASMTTDADRYVSTYGRNADWRLGGVDINGKPHTPNTVRLLARQWQAEPLALLSFLEQNDSWRIAYLMDHVRDFVADVEARTVETGGNDVFERFYAGHRTRNWLGMHQLLLASPAYRWQDQLMMIKVFMLHAVRLHEGCRKFNYGNHQLVGLTGLYEVGVMFPEFPALRRWGDHARNLILEHATKEIARDGFQFERASHYFKLDIINYFRFLRISERNRVPLPDDFRGRFRAMFDAMVSLLRPDGTLPVLQDAQDVYGAADSAGVRAGFGTARSSNAAELAEPGEAVFMSLGALLFSDPVYRSFGEPRFPPALFWFFNPSERDRYASMAKRPPSVGSIGLPQTGYYVMRSGWQRESLYMVIDGGRAVEKPDHTHGGILGVVAHAFGEDILPNYRVRYSDPSYRVLKNSLVKNVALADTLLHGQYWKDNAARTGFGIWQKLPTPTVGVWAPGTAYDYFSASHNGFDSIGVRYRRTVLFLKSRFWLFIDRFSSETPHSYQQIWQGLYSPVVPGRARFSARGVDVTIAQADTQVECAARVVAGRPSVRWEKRGIRDYSFVTVVYPQIPGAGPALQISTSSVDGGTKVSITTGKHRDDILLTDTASLSTPDPPITVFSYAGERLESAFVSGQTGFRAGQMRLVLAAPASVEVVRGTDGKFRPSVLAGDAGTVRLHVSP